MTDRAARIATALGIVTIVLGAGHLVGSLGLSAAKGASYTIRTAHLVWIGQFMVVSGLLQCLAIAQRASQPLANQVLTLGAISLIVLALTLLPVMLRPLSPFLAGPVFLLLSNGWLLTRLRADSTSRAE